MGRTQPISPTTTVGTTSIVIIIVIIIGFFKGACSLADEKDYSRKLEEQYKH